MALACSGILGKVPTSASPPTQAAALAAALLDRYQRAGVESNEHIESLVELAVSENPKVAHAGADAIFRLIVERLGDRFEKRGCDLYVRFFGRVVEICRRLPQARWLDERLRAFGLHTEREFLDRAERVRQAAASPAHISRQIKKVLVLSRVTLGADVAVTSVVLHRMKRAFENAEICFLCGAKSASLFASDTRLTPVEIRYRRGGALLERLAAWPTLADCIAVQTQGLQPGEYLIVDPDSRLTQLGLLPVTPEGDSYLFFESRSYASPGAETLGELTGRWLDAVFGSDGKPNYPYVSLPEQDQDLGRAVRRASRQELAAVSFGAGGNPAKQLTERFERDLLLALLDAGYTVLLDRGAGEDELRRTAELAAAVRDAGKTVGGLHAGISSLQPLNTWEGSLSGFAALIGVSDLYVGYDSAGGHLAAALGVPGIDLFSGAASPRMRERWRPWGRRPAQVIAAEEEPLPGEVLRRARERPR